MGILAPEMPGPKIQELVIFHYHFLPGGVTSVVEKAVAALRRWGASPEGGQRPSREPLPEKIRLVCGREENTAELAERLNKREGERREGSSPSDPAPVKIDIVPEIDYLNPESGLAPGFSTIKKVLTERYLSNNKVWWVHNYQLGKNPLFTKALLDVLRTSTFQRALLQIHDFPECSRYENLDFLKTYIEGPLYPQLPNIRYVLINARDRDFLLEAGISPDLLFLLQNPVTGEEGKRKWSDEERLERREVVAGYFKDRFPAYVPNAAWLLYPIRTIRRKNVLEAGLINRILSRPTNLIVTLPGVSETELTYSNLVERCFREGIIGGLWGIGRELSDVGLQFHDLVEVSDLVISSSIQEGFGYQFVSPLSWGKPLFGRNLDILAGLKDLLEGFPHHLYDSVLVPFRSPSLHSVSLYLKTRYQEKLDALSRYLPRKVLETLYSQIEEMVRSDYIDFSYLSAEMQYTYLKDLNDEGFRTEVQRLNSGLLKKLEDLLSRDAKIRDERLEQFLGPERFANNFGRLLLSFDKGAAIVSKAEEGNVENKLIELFAQIRYIHLLYEPLGIVSEPS